MKTGREIQTPRNLFSKLPTLFIRKQTKKFLAVLINEFFIIHWSKETFSLFHFNRLKHQTSCFAFKQLLHEKLVVRKKTPEGCGRMWIKGAQATVKITLKFVLFGGLCCCIITSSLLFAKGLIAQLVLMQYFNGFVRFDFPPVFNLISIRQNFWFYCIFIGLMSDVIIYQRCWEDILLSFITTSCNCDRIDKLLYTDLSCTGSLLLEYPLYYNLPKSMVIIVTFFQFYNK